MLRVANPAFRPAHANVCIADAGFAAVQLQVGQAASGPCLEMSVLNAAERRLVITAVLVVCGPSSCSGSSSMLVMAVHPIEAESGDLCDVAMEARPQWSDRDGLI